MQQQHRNNARDLVLLIAGFILLAILATYDGAWSAPAPSGGGSVPYVPTPYFTPPIPIPVTGLGACCLPGIAFTSYRDGNAEIYVMKADGSNLLRLTNNPAVDQHPGPSPDGLRIAFSSDRDDPDWSTCGTSGKPNCKFDLYVMNIDGSDVRRLTYGTAQDSQPAWSPGGGSIAFVSTADDPDPTTCGQPGRPACVLNIYRVNVNGSAITRVTPSVPGNPSASNWDPNWAPDESRIAFTSNRDGNDEIYTIAPDGTRLTRLTNDAASDGHPAWSPDGSQIVFESNREGHYQLYLMNPDGSGVRRLTSSNGDDRYPIWRPGCTNRILFASNRDGVFRVWAVDPDGLNPVRLTTLPNSSAIDTLPAWSGLPATLRPRGACCVPGIAFDSTRDNSNEEIYIMRYDGSQLTRLTFNDWRDMHPSPSPNGTTIVFESNRDGHFQLYVMGVDGSGTTRLTNSPKDDREAAWSLDNQRIAFVSNRERNDRIYVVNADGSGEMWLTNPSTGGDSNPSWSPDSKQIVFQSNRDGNDEIYIMNADGSNQTRLTHDPASDGHPSISNDGKRIAFESNRSGTYQVYVMNIDGSNVHPITSIGENRRPNWCPSCEDRIVFVSNRDGGAMRIYAMNGDSSDQVRLTSLPAGPSGAGKPDDRPAWSGLPLPRMLSPNVLGQ